MTIHAQTLDLVDHFHSRGIVMGGLHTTQAEPFDLPANGFEQMVFTVCVVARAACADCDTYSPHVSQRCQTIKIDSDRFIDSVPGIKA